MKSIRTCISFQASAAAKVVTRLSRARLAPHGVTPIQFAVLQAVFEAERVKRLVLTSKGAAVLPAMQASMDEMNADIDAAMKHSTQSVRESLQSLANLHVD